MHIGIQINFIICVSYKICWKKHCPDQYEQFRVFGAKFISELGFSDVNNCMRFRNLPVVPFGFSKHNGILFFVKFCAKQKTLKNIRTLYFCFKVS